VSQEDLAMSDPRQPMDTTPSVTNPSPTTPIADVETDEAAPEPGDCASPPCALHEVDPDYRGF